MYLKAPWTVRALITYYLRLDKDLLQAFLSFFLFFFFFFTSNANL